MPTTMKDVTAKIDAVKSTMDKEKVSEGEPITTETTEEKPNEAKSDPEKEPNGATFKGEEVPVEVEPKTVVSFAVKLENRKQLKAVGLRKKSMLGMGIKIYGFIGKAPSKPTNEIYGMVIDSDSGMMVQLVIVFSYLTMSMDHECDIKLTSGFVIEISRLPGYVLQTKVKGEIVRKVESELLCRAFIYMYLGDGPFDKEAKEKFRASMLSLF
ncbi:unnamed protein product [Withania somnifera]